ATTTSPPRLSTASLSGSDGRRGVELGVGTGRAVEQSHLVRLAVEDRGRAVGAVNALEMGGGRPAHALADWPRVLPGDLVGDIDVAHGQRRRPLLGPRRRRCGEKDRKSDGGRQKTARTAWRHGRITP